MNVNTLCLETWIVSKEVNASIASLPYTILSSVDRPEDQRGESIVLEIIPKYLDDKNTLKHMLALVNLLLCVILS